MLTTTAPARSGSPRQRPRRALRRTGAIVGVLAIGVLSLVSVAVGTRDIPLPTTLDAVLAFDPTNDLHLITMHSRIPRTILAILVGMALGLAGTIMQAITRNPLAEPGLLGVNSGAAAAVAIGAATFSITNILGYVWFAFIGAAAASVAVALLGRAHDVGTDPVRLVLAGAGLSVVLGAVTTVVVLNAPPEVYDVFRTWMTGSFAGRGYEVLPVVGMVCLAGFVLAFSISNALNSIALGRDFSAALGVSSRSTWTIAALSVLLLAGGATAAVGPIAFVGLAAPHLARVIVGPDHRWLLPYSLILSALLLLVADVLGRVVARPGEISAGVMTAIIGGPFFIYLVRKRRMARL